MRIADLVDALPLVQLCGRRHIDHEPTLLEFQVLHAGADRGADQAVRAVAAEQIPRLHPVLLAADPIGERDLRSVGADLNGFGHLGVAPENGVRVMLQVRPQQRFELRLVEHVRLRVAVGAFGALPVKLRHYPHVPVPQLQTARRSGDRRELISNAQSGQ